jgi:hypothetical protein
MTGTRDTRQPVSLMWLEAQTTRPGSGVVLAHGAHPIQYVMKLLLQRLADLLACRRFLLTPFLPHEVQAQVLDRPSPRQGVVRFTLPAIAHLLLTGLLPHDIAALLRLSEPLRPAYRLRPPTKGAVRLIEIWHTVVAPTPVHARIIRYRHQVLL